MFGAAVSQQLRILAVSSEECQSRSNEGGDFIYIKPGVPHEVFNMSDTNPSWPLWPARPPTTGTTWFLTTAISRAEIFTPTR
jgi:hypothetical protein